MLIWTNFDSHKSALHAIRSTKQFFFFQKENSGERTFESQLHVGGVIVRFNPAGQFFSELCEVCDRLDMFHVMEGNMRRVIADIWPPELLQNVTENRAFRLQLIRRSGHLS